MLLQLRPENQSIDTNYEYTWVPFPDPGGPKRTALMPIFSLALVSESADMV